jgi:hypothetical protein
VRPETVAEIWIQHTRHGVVSVVCRSHGGDHGRTIYPSGGGRCFLFNVRDFLPEYTASHP